MKLVRSAQLIIAACFLGVVFLKNLSQFSSGVLIGVCGVITAFAGFVFLIKREETVLSLAFFVFGGALTMWGISALFGNDPTKHPIATVSVPLLLSSSFYLFNIGISLKFTNLVHFFKSSWRISAVSFFVSVAFYFFLFSKYISQTGPYLTIPSYRAMEFFSLGAHCLTTALAFIVFITSPELEWTLFSAGLICSATASSMFHVESILKTQIVFNSNAMFILAGSFIAMLAFNSAIEMKCINNVEENEAYPKTKKHLYSLLLLSGFISFINDDRTTAEVVSQLIFIFSISGCFFTYQTYLSEQSEIAAMNKIFKQMHHDLKAPNASLQSILEDSRIPDGLRSRLDWTMKRYNDIMSSPLRQQDVESDVFLYSTLESLVEELRLSSSVNISFLPEPETYQIYVSCKEADLVRAISNLIDNAYKAIDSSGKIEVRLAERDNQVLVEIRDTGRGIPKHILNKLGRPGVYYGEKKGSGLGLAYAMEIVEKSGGRFAISSTENIGTTVILEFKAQKLPDLESVQAVLIDDHWLVRETWLSAAKIHGIKLLAISSIDEFHKYSRWISRHADIFVDHNLGNGQNGLSEAILIRDKMGFHSVSVATGEPPEELKNTDKINIVGKMPPWSKNEVKGRFLA